MNPILRNLPNNNLLSQISNIRQLINGDPAAAFGRMMQTNPQFRQFVEANKGKTPEQIASEYGIDFNQVRNLIK